MPESHSWESRQQELNGVGSVRFRRFRNGHRRPTVAGITTHMLFAIRESGVNVTRHRDHHSSDALFRVVVTGKVPLNMALGAHGPESRIERQHGVTKTVLL